MMNDEIISLLLLFAETLIGIVAVALFIIVHRKSS